MIGLHGMLALDPIAVSDMSEREKGNIILHRMQKMAG